MTMMGRHSIFFVLLLSWLCGMVYAQQLTIAAIESLPMDLSASTYLRPDANGDPCALVKVQLSTAGAQFEGNVVGQVDYKTGEYWVYMTAGSYMLKVKHPSFVPLSVNFRDYGINKLQGKATYQLTLLMPQMSNMNVDDGMRYLAMTVEPASATVYIDNQPQLLQNGVLSMLLPMGQHQYRVESPAYETKNGTFTIGDETLQLPVRLESVMAQLTVSSDTPGTQIYINDQLRGTSSWTGSLPAGTYRVEGRLQGYRHHRQNIILAQRDRQQVTIPALQAITGNLNVNCQPLNAEVYLDGQLLGKSPSVYRNVMVGSHNVELRASGYTSKQELITIEKGKTAMLSGTLEPEPAAQGQAQAQTSATPVSGSSVETITVNGVSFNMIRVDGGTFTIEKPTHQVTLSTFSIGETEVTQALWEAVMGNNPSHFKGMDKPVEQVSWNDCQEFIRKLNAATGRPFRLPTEAEWEYAARGGSKSRGYIYSGSNTIDDVATTTTKGTQPVKLKAPNELGIYDMSGNVDEWCQDWWGDYSSTPQTNPTGPQIGSRRVVRGGDWKFGARFCRSSWRGVSTPTRHSKYLGLRLAL